MTQPWYTTFQVIKGPLGESEGMGGGAGGTCFSGGTEGDQSSPKGCLGGGGGGGGGGVGGGGGGGGGRPYQTDCKLTANKGESQEYYRAF